MSSALGLRFRGDFRSFLLLLRSGSVAALMVVIMITSHVASADTLRVPDEYTTIQEAIDAAVTDDVVLLADGTYTGPGNRDIDFRGKAITVQSEFGPTNCIIDCEDLGRGFIFQSGESADSVLQGITILNGRTTIVEGSGAGIRCVASSPSIINCVIDSCNSVQNGSGGAIAVIDADLYLDSCVISNNFCDDDGGGVYVSSGTAVIIDTTFDNNGATGSVFGGGALCVVGHAQVRNSVFTFNTAFLGAGGASFSSGTLVDCRFEDNESEAFDSNGGAIVGDAFYFNCEFRRNRSGDDGFGGAVFGNGTFLDCTFESNAATEGGAVHGSGSFDHCTFMTNEGLAVYCSDRSWFDTCVFDGNIGFFSGGAVFAHESSGGADFIDCEFKNNFCETGGAFAGAGTFQRCTFTNNDCAFSFNDQGGGAANITGNSTFIECQFNNNESQSDGGGALWIENGDVFVQDSSFSRNQAFDAGGAISVQPAGSAMLRLWNTAFCENTPDDVNGAWIDLGGNTFETWCDCIHLDVTNLVAGDMATFTVLGGPPQGFVAALWGEDPGVFTFSNSSWCVDFQINVPQGELLNRVLFSGTLDSAGELTRARLIPSEWLGKVAYFQAALRATCPDPCMSNVWNGVVE